MDKIDLSLRTLGGGSLPHTDPDAACRLVLDTLDIPTWPQLPRRSFRENMYVQFSERFPGVVLADERIYVDRSQDLDPQLEQLYLAYLGDDLAYGTISHEYAAGLHRFLHLDVGRPPAVKGQVTGPVSWGLTVVDQDRRPVLYDDVLADAVAKHLRLKAAWMERELRRLSPQTIIFIDEPYMSSFGSAYISLERDQAIEPDCRGPGRHPGPEGRPLLRQHRLVAADGHADRHPALRRLRLCRVAGPLSRRGAGLSGAGRADRLGHRPGQRPRSAKRRPPAWWTASRRPWACSPPRACTATTCWPRR